jgi:DNA-binding NarL/FixJ family response regulator
MSQIKSIKVIIADDHPIIRFGMKRYLEHAPGVSVVGEAENGQESLRLTRELRPDILILDLDMPVMNGVQVLKILHQEMPALKILVISEDYAEYSSADTKAMGASGHFLKTEDYDRLIKTVRGESKTSHRSNSFMSVGLPGL